MLGPRSWTFQTGPNEPVHYVHVWELHLHLPHHDGRHDDVQTSQDLVLCEASFQGV